MPRKDRGRGGGGKNGNGAHKLRPSAYWRHEGAGERKGLSLKTLIIVKFYEHDPGEPVHRGTSTCRFSLAFPPRFFPFLIYLFFSSVFLVKAKRS